MSPYVRTVKTASGAHAVQIVHSTRRGSRDIEHIGSAHDDGELELLKAAARQRLAAGQGELDLGMSAMAGAGSGGPLPITSSRMAHLWDALVSAANEKAIEDAGLSFILGARVPYVPYVVKTWRTAHPGEQIPDRHIFTQPWPAGPTDKRRDQVIYYQYRADRARRTLRGIDEQVTKAESAAAGKTAVKRNRFVKLTGATKSVNRALETKTRSLAGIKGYADVGIMPRSVGFGLVTPVGCQIAGRLTRAMARTVAIGVDDRAVRLGSPARDRYCACCRRWTWPRSPRISRCRHFGLMRSSDLVTTEDWPGELGATYEEACALLGVELRPGGYAMTLGLDGSGARYTVLSKVLTTGCHGQPVIPPDRLTHQKGAPDST
jgi:hypothetical protein